MSGIVVVKIGGVASDNLSQGFFEKMKSMQKEGKKIVIVHGGGHYISEMMSRLDMEVIIKGGLRVTTPEVLDITKMVLVGQVQPMIIQEFQKANIKSSGLHASEDDLITGEILDETSFGFVGTVTNVKTDLINTLLEKNYVPIIAPLGMTKNQHQWLNINADEVACKVAEALKAEALYLLTDVPGVKYHEKWLTSLPINGIDELVSEKAIVGGMIPKLESASLAIQSGVKVVHITDALEKSGTIIKDCKGVAI